MNTRQLINDYVNKLPSLNSKYLTTHLFYPTEVILDTSMLPMSMEHEFFHNLVLTCKNVNHVFHTNRLIRKLVQIYIGLLVNSRDVQHSDGLEKYIYLQFVDFETDPYTSIDQKIRLLQQFDNEILRLLCLPKDVAIKSKLVEKVVYRCSLAILARFMESILYVEYFNPKMIQYIANRSYMIRNNNLSKLFDWFPIRFRTKNSNIQSSVNSKKVMYNNTNR